MVLVLTALNWTQTATRTDLVPGPERPASWSRALFWVGAAWFCSGPQPAEPAAGRAEPAGRQTGSKVTLQPGGRCSPAAARRYLQGRGDGEGARLDLWDQVQQPVRFQFCCGERKVCQNLEPQPEPGHRGEPGLSRQTAGMTSDLQRGAARPATVRLQLVLTRRRAELQQLVPLQVRGRHGSQQLEEGAARNGRHVQVTLHQAAHRARPRQPGRNWVRTAQISTRTCSSGSMWSGSTWSVAVWRQRESGVRVQPEQLAEPLDVVL